MSNNNMNNVGNGTSSANVNLASTHIVAASLNGLLPTPTVDTTPTNPNSSNKKHRESYTVRDKILMVRKFQNEDPPMSVRKFAATYNIPSNTFKHWIQLYEAGIPEELTGNESQSRRRIRPGKYPALEKKVVDFLRSRNTNEPRLHFNQLRELCEGWAKDLLTEHERSDFVLSHGWIVRVLKRNSLFNVEGVDSSIYTNGANEPNSLAGNTANSSLDMSRGTSSNKRPRQHYEGGNAGDYSSDSGMENTGGLGNNTMIRNGVVAAVQAAMLSGVPLPQPFSSFENPSIEDVDTALKVIIQFARQNRYFDILDMTYQLSIQIRDQHTSSVDPNHTSNNLVSDAMNTMQANASSSNSGSNGNTMNVVNGQV